MSTEATLPSAVAEARAELDRLAQGRPTLASHARLLGDILPILFSETPVAPFLPFAPDQGVARLSQGIPLLRGESLAFDLPAFVRRWKKIWTAIGRQTGQVEVDQLAQRALNGQPRVAEVVQTILAGRPEALRQWAKELQLDRSLLATVLRWALIPVLAPIQAALAAVVAGSRWEQGCCPVCGSWPLLGELRGPEQFRYLRCGLCSAAWEFPRLLCPFCGNRDHRRLGYFHVEGEEARQRVAVCDVCRGYVKTVATLAPLSGPYLLVADLATLHLDLAAAQRGYSVT